MGATQRLADGFYELIWKTDGVIDLKFRYQEVHQWFASDSLAGDAIAVYLPASLAVLWPFVGYESWFLAQWLWVLTTAAVLAWLAYFAAKGSGANGMWERAVVTLLPLAVYTARAVIVNGQLMLHFLLLFLGGEVVLTSKTTSSFPHSFAPYGDTSPHSSAGHFVHADVNTSSSITSFNRCMLMYMRVPQRVPPRAVSEPPPTSMLTHRRESSLLPLSAGGSPS